MNFNVDIVLWSMDGTYELVIDGEEGHFFPTPYFLCELSLKN